jgi:hypothetical protein
MAGTKLADLSFQTIPCKEDEKNDMIFKPPICIQSY